MGKSLTQDKVRFVPVRFAAVEHDDISKTELYLDRAGIWLSTICMVHCVLTPVALLLLPMMTFIKSEWVHVLLACVLPLVAFGAFVPGFKRHRDPFVILLGLLGLFLIVFAAFDPFSILNVVTESIVTSSGSVALISAHLRNRHLKNCCALH